MRWFHSGGIFAALSPTTAEIIIEAMQAAKAAGAVVSFDFNFREKLWEASVDKGPGADRAQAVLRRIVQYVDVLVGVPNVSDAVKAYPQYQDRRRYPTRSAFRQSAWLERHGMDQRPNLYGAHL